MLEFFRIFYLLPKFLNKFLVIFFFQATVFFLTITLQIDIFPSVLSLFRNVIFKLIAIFPHFYVEFVPTFTFKFKFFYLTILTLN